VSRWWRPPSGPVIDSGPALTRVTAFSDGVFAIAITLLVLNLDVPRLAAGDEHLLGDELLDQWQKYLAYALSFAIIARFWRVHHRLFSAVTRLDERAMSLNLLHLAAIVLIPFATEVLGEYSDQPAAVVTYALVLTGATLAGWVLAWHALRAGLIVEHDLPDERVRADAVGLLRPALFALSIPVAFLSTSVAELMWLGALLRPRRGRGGRSAP
jgi:uncharacterized membrane protein